LSKNLLVEGLAKFLVRSFDGQFIERSNHDFEVLLVTVHREVFQLKIFELSTFQLVCSLVRKKLLSFAE
jgi:hypothetical protein